MAEIQEISLDDIPEEVVEEEPEVVVAAPKKRGRPPGAQNKAKPAPKPSKPKPAPAPAPKTKAKKKRYVPPSPSSSEDEAPRAVQAPEVDRRTLAAEVLGLLQDQRVSRGMARRQHYATWFQNM
jgi:hypothetical protein